MRSLGGPHRLFASCPKGDFLGKLIGRPFSGAVVHRCRWLCGEARSRYIAVGIIGLSRVYNFLTERENSLLRMFSCGRGKSRFSYLHDICERRAVRAWNRASAMCAWAPMMRDVTEALRYNHLLTRAFMYTRESRDNQRHVLFVLPNRWGWEPDKSCCRIVDAVYFDALANIRVGNGALVRFT